MFTNWPMLATNCTLKNPFILLRLAGLACALLLSSRSVHGQDMAWPQFRGPESNPVGTHARLAERWSKTENVEWSQADSRARVVFADCDGRQSLRDHA